MPAWWARWPEEELRAAAARLERLAPPVAEEIGAPLVTAEIRILTVAGPLAVVLADAEPPPRDRPVRP